MANENGGIFAHQTSWPCVSATIFDTPSPRKVFAMMASGAAAPNQTCLILF